MTAILNIASSTLSLRAARLVLMGASGIALATPLAANEVLFSTNAVRPEAGQRTRQSGGLTQVVLTSGAVVSIVDAADYQINADGSVDLYEGTITVSAGPDGGVIVRLPGGLEGRVGETGASANFTAREGRGASGHALTGVVLIGRAGALERFAAGAMWRAEAGRSVRRVLANEVQAQPGEGNAASAEAATLTPIGGEAGPVAAALNGLPQGLGDQLAGAGASSDIIAAARRIEGVAGNPVLETFPSGDLALLVAAAARIDRTYGGSPFPESEADIIRAYLRFLAGGGAGSTFLASYSHFAHDYLDLIRAGGLPSSFAATGPQDIDAWLAYIRRTGAIDSLAARDRVLAEAYLAFLASGGNRDSFARSFTDLTVAYFAFVRGGGDPAAFTDANTASLAQTIAFLRDSGLTAQLGAADRALIEAYLANGGLAFAAQYRAAFADYAAFLASGQRPSEYTAADQAALRAWLETLADTGLLTTVLGERAEFFADYLAYLRAGGTPDEFARLPANIFAGYATDLRAFLDFLAAGGVPSLYDRLTLAQIRDYIAALEAAGASARFLGELAAFYREYAAYLVGGGNPDLFAGLPVQGGGGGGGGAAPTLLAQLANAQFLRSFPGGATATTGTNVTLTDTGQITNVTIGPDSLPLPGGVTGPYDQRGLVLEAAGRFGNAVAFTSYRDPNPVRGSNFVTHIVAGVPTAVLPQTGLVSYRLVGGAAPTEQGLANGTEGYFTGNLAVAFGQAQPLIGLDFTVVSGGTTFISGTPGGAQDPLNNGMVLASTGRFTGQFAASATAGNGCARANACFATVVGSFFGEAAGHVGLVYSLNDNSVRETPRLISGSAVFGREGTALSGIGTPPGDGGSGGGSSGNGGNGGDGGGSTGTLPAGTGNPPGASITADHVFSHAGVLETLNYNTNASSLGSVIYETNAAGQITGMRNRGDTMTDRIGTARNADTGRTASGDLRWTRWTDGTLDVRRNFPADPVTLDANEGYHILVGTPATNLPTSGRIDYTLIGGTSPTSALGTAAPGRLVRGAAAVEFGTTSRVGIEMALEYGGQSFAVSTRGGLTSVGLSEIRIGRDATFTAGGAYGLVTSSGAYCASTCRVLWDGFLAGEGARELGVTYRIHALNAETNQLIGSAAFASTAAAPASGTAPAADWSRWAATGDPVEAAGGLVGRTTGAGAALSALATGTTDPAAGADHQAAIRTAERMMGGLVTFDAAGTVPGN